MILKFSKNEQEVLNHYIHHMILLSLQNKDKPSKKYLTRLQGRISNSSGHCNLKVKDLAVCVNILTYSNNLIENDTIPKIKESDKENKEQIIERLTFFLENGKKALETIKNINVLPTEA